MYYQSLDDKTECVGVYTDGKLFFDSPPAGLVRTWRHSGFSPDNAEYAWIVGGGKQLSEVCPVEMQEELHKAQLKFKAYLKSFKPYSWKWKYKRKMNALIFIPIK